ncbi:MAG: hypothetical protein JWN40_5892 [Phycisphaerales bacterium]|nr:hypothetical protein [Phycisphaerales bacterium]
MTRTTFFAVLVLTFIFVPQSRAQVIFPPVFGTGNGVYIDADGTLHQRQTDTANDLATQRLRAKALNQPPKAQDLTYISLPRLLAKVQSLTEQKKELPDDLRYLSGLTQIRYVFVYPEEHDLVIAGPSEAFDATVKTEPHGKVTGRPVLHLDDLVTALRNARAFGCSLDPHPDSLNRSNAVMKEFANATRGERMNALKEAVGAQQVRLFGVPADTRLAFVTIAADYKLKRLMLGLDPMPVPGVGSPVDNSRAAANRFWFEVNYAPLLVSPDGDAFELRGPRLLIKPGAFSTDTKGATDSTKAFAKNFTAKIPQLATVVPLFADLQNIADLSVVAALIQKDRLDRKAGVDLAWIRAEDNYKPTPVPTPRTAETLVNYTNGSIVAGGVTLDASNVVAADNREQDGKDALKPVKGRPSSDSWTHTKAGAK